MAVATIRFFQSSGLSPTTLQRMPCTIPVMGLMASKVCSFCGKISSGYIIGVKYIHIVSKNVKIILMSRYNAWSGAKHNTTPNVKRYIREMNNGSDSSCALGSILYIDIIISNAHTPIIRSSNGAVMTPMGSTIRGK